MKEKLKQTGIIFLISAFLFGTIMFFRVIQEVSLVEKNAKDRIDTFQALLDQQSVMPTSASFWHFLSFLKLDEVTFFQVLDKTQTPLLSHTIILKPHLHR